MMATNERKRAYDAEYTKKYLKQYILRVSRKTSQNVIDWLSSKENVNDYIKSLVEADMIKHGINPNEEQEDQDEQESNGNQA